MTKKFEKYTESRLDEVVSSNNIGGDELLEMANAPKSITKTPVIIWIQSNSELGTGQHNTPRLKFQNNKSDKLDKSSLIPLSIEDNPKILIKNYKLEISSKELMEICDWVSINKDLLLKHWNGEITSFEVFSSCKTK